MTSKPKKKYKKEESKTTRIRTCLRCDREFKSISKENRICPKCKPTIDAMTQYDQYE